MNGSWKKPSNRLGTRNRRHFIDSNEYWKYLQNLFINYNFYSYQIRQMKPCKNINKFFFYKNRLKFSKISSYSNANSIELCEK